MAEVLSQQEIDALLNNIKTGGQATTTGPEKEILPFDFRLPNRISKNQIRTIRNIHENFAEQISSYLLSKLQAIVNINVISVDQIYYSEYVLSVGSPSCLYLFDVKGTDIKGILEIGTELTLAVVDRLLGGSGVGTKQSKQITPIEQRVLAPIIEKMMAELKKAWQTVDEMEFVIERFESDIDFAQITSQSESVLIISFEVYIGDQSFLMNLCYATFAFDTILSKLSAQKLSSIRPTKYNGKSAKTVITEHIEKTYLDINVEFGRAIITFKDMINLRVGDIIKMNTRVGDPLKILINNKHLFWGLPGTVNGHKAVKVLKKVEEEEL
jgi:flagellar motor switch protein FliM